MKTSQSYIARIEGGKVRPSTDALERFAQATRTRLRIIFEPEPLAEAGRTTGEELVLSMMLMRCLA